VLAGIASGIIIGKIYQVTFGSYAFSVLDAIVVAVCVSYIIGYVAKGF